MVYAFYKVGVTIVLLYYILIRTYMNKQYFTFGTDHYPGIKYYVEIEGDYITARTKMNTYFNGLWAFQYESKEDAGVEKYNLLKYELPKKLIQKHVKLTTLAVVEQIQTVLGINDDHLKYLARINHNDNIWKYKELYIDHEDKINSEIIK